MPPLSSDTLIAAILRHDRKVTSYKIALIRALNDMVLSFPDVVGWEAMPEEYADSSDVAVPLRMLAQFWVAYYWPFTEPRNPICQGQFTRRAGVTRADISFRPDLERLWQQWEVVIGTSGLASDGFFLRSEFQTPRRRTSYPAALQQAFDAAVRSCMEALGQPIRYAGEGEYGLFEPPCALSRMQRAIALPGARPEDICLRVSASLWASFRALSLWIEALSIHEWALFTENAVRAAHKANGAGTGNPPHRGDIYFLLTARPDNRRPLTWERNRIEILMMEGARFTCPWTRKILTASSHFDIDHLLPLAVYPANEMWNLVPADRRFNQQVKRDRIPSHERLRAAEPLVARTYALYQDLPDLKSAIQEDASVRFRGIAPGHSFSMELSRRALRFIGEVAEARGVARF